MHSLRSCRAGVDGPSMHAEVSMVLSQRSTCVPNSSSTAMYRDILRHVAQASDHVGLSAHVVYGQAQRRWSQEKWKCCMLNACTPQASAIKHAAPAPTLKDLRLPSDHQQLRRACRAIFSYFTDFNSNAAVLVLLSSCSSLGQRALRRSSVILSTWQCSSSIFPGASVFMIM